MEQGNLNSLSPAPAPEPEAALIKASPASKKTLMSSEGDQNGSLPADRQGVALRFSEVCSESQSGTFPPVIFLLISGTCVNSAALVGHFHTADFSSVLPHSRAFEEQRHKPIKELFIGVDWDWCVVSVPLEKPTNFCRAQSKHEHTNSSCLSLPEGFCSIPGTCTAV